MRLLIFIAVLVALFFVAGWAARRMRLKERVRNSVQRTKERLGRLKRLIIKLSKIAVVCLIGFFTISELYYYSLSDVEREELERRQAKQEEKRQMALRKQENAIREAQIRNFSTVSSGGTGSCYQRGVSYYREIGSYPYLKSPPNAGLHADTLINKMCSKNPSAFRDY